MKVVSVKNPEIKIIKQENFHENSDFPPIGLAL